MINDNSHFPFGLSLPVFFLIASVYCLCIEVEEVKRRQHCLMFSSAGSQAQTYFVNFDTLADYQRWHRQASKVSKRQRVCVTVCTATVCLFPVGSAKLLLKSEVRCYDYSCLLPFELSNQKLPVWVHLIGSHRGRLSAVSGTDWTAYLCWHSLYFYFCKRKLLMSCYLFLFFTMALSSWAFVI